MSKKNKDRKKRPIFLELFLLILVSSIFFIVIYSAMQEGNHKRRIIVPEALDAPYQPYRSTENRTDRGMVTPMDSMMRDVYVVQREINQGSHQLYLFFDTFTHRPARLDLKHFDLKDPKDAQWYNFGIYFIMFLLVAFPTISAFIAKNFFKKKLDNEEYKDKTWLRIKSSLDFITNHRIMIVFVVFLIAILLSMVNPSIPLEKEFEYRADPFFVFVCFSSIAVAIIALKYVLKGLKRIKIGGDSSLSGKSIFRQTLFWGALGIWAMGFLCYFIGMYSLGTQKSVLASIVRPALESGKMFVLSDSTKEISFTLRNNGAFMGFYTICKLGFLLISSFALVSLAWSRIVTYSSSVHRSSDPGELYVFFGINENSKILAQDIAQRLRAEQKKKDEEIRKKTEEKRQCEEGIKRLSTDKRKAENNKKLYETIPGKRKRSDDKSDKRDETNKQTKRIEKLDGKIEKLDERINKLYEKINNLNSEIEEAKKVIDKQWTIVMVENRNNPIDGVGNGLSINSLISMFNFRKDAYDETRKVDRRALLIICDSAIGSRECSEQIKELAIRTENGEELDKDTKYDLFNSLGLKNLSKMIKYTNIKPGSHNKCHFFFLDDDARSNIDATDNFRTMLKIVHPDNTEKTIYCLARNNAFSSLLERSNSTFGKDETSNINVKILDLSVMAAQSLFMNPDNHPINFVDCDPATATVKSRFEALILGFGRSGRDIVRYLYEFGAFLDYGARNEEDAVVRSPFLCTIMDKDIEMIRPRFLAKIPAVKASWNNHDKNGALLQFEKAALNSDEFVSLIDEKLKIDEETKTINLNFVVINMGSDKTNMGALTYLVDQAMRLRDGKLGKLRIFVRNYDPAFEDAMCDRAEHYNQLLGNNAVVNVFGRRSELLSYDIVVDDHTIFLAKTFHHSYKNYKGKNKEKKNIDELWAQRHNQNQSIGLPDNNLENDSSTKWEWQNYVLRQETQDIHNGIHFDTKLGLIGLKRQTHFEKVINEQIDMLLGLKEYTHQGGLSKEQTEKLTKIHEHINCMVQGYIQDQLPTSKLKWWTRVMGWLKNISMTTDSDLKEIQEQKANEILEYLENETQYKDLLPFIDKKLIDELHQLKDAILFTDNGSNYLFTSSRLNDVDMHTIYRNLARNEHIRWVASMEMLGYSRPDNKKLNSMVKCDEAAKVHPGMADRNNANNQKAQEVFDHMLVKCSFELAYKELLAQRNTFDAIRKELLRDALEKMIQQAQNEATEQAKKLEKSEIAEESGADQ